jgi:hypothetical protein
MDMHRESSIGTEPRESLESEHQHVLCSYGWPEEMDCPNVATSCSCKGGKHIAGRCEEHPYATQR